MAYGASYLKGTRFFDRRGMIAGPSPYSQVAERPSLDKKQNAPSPTALSSAGDFHEMKTGGIVVCSTFVALVYIPEYSYGRSVTQPT